MNFVDHLLHTHFDEFELASHGLRRNWGTVLLTPRFVTSRHLVALIFNPGGRVPVLVVKVPRQPNDNEGVRRESEILSRLTALAPRDTSRWPTVVATLDVGDHTALVETGLSGAPLDPNRVLADPSAAVRAGEDFVASLPIASSAAGNAGWYDRTIAAPLRALVELAPLGGESAKLAERTHLALASLQNTALPAVFEHADLSHPNLFIKPGGQLQVVDWERATPDGVPGHDLIFFLQYVSESAKKAFLRPEQLEANDEVMGPDGWALPVLRKHLRLRGVDPDLSRPLILAAWARSAATLAYRLAAQSESKTAPDQERLDEAVSADRDFWLWRHVLKQGFV
jgi:hypothetical protein